MKILFLAGRELKYSRNELIIKLIRAENSVQLIGDQGKKQSIFWRSLRGAAKALTAISRQKFDLIFIGFYGNILALILGIFSKGPILFDAFVSTYDTLCFDREIFHPQSILGLLTKRVDQLSCKLSKRIIVDTRASGEYFSHVLGVPAEKIDVLYVGCDDSLFFPQNTEVQKKTVLFYGTFLPLHGVDIIIQAAKIIQKVDREVQFQIIGSGKKYLETVQIARDLKLSNVQFLPPVPLAELSKYIGRADVCLCGHFGHSAKAGRVIATKTFQCAAMAKPVIVGRNAANAEIFTHGHDTWFVEMNNPAALAEGIMTLLENETLKNLLGQNARGTHLQKVSNDHLARVLDTIIKKTIS